MRAFCLILLLMSIPATALAQPVAKFASTLTGFLSESQFNAYLQPKLVDRDSSAMNSNEADDLQADDLQVGTPGGIIKNLGDSLIILQQGRLYAIDIKTKGQAKLTDTVSVARHESLNQNVLYDEVLVHDDMIYVVGQRTLERVSPSPDGNSSKITDATEFSSFRLTHGKLTRLKSTFFESNGDYSLKNNTSHIFNDRLITYTSFMPHSVEATGVFPQQLTYSKPTATKTVGVFHPVKPLFGWRDVVRPEQAIGFGFQTVLSCELPKDGSLDCKARALLDQAPSALYVSANHVFLWSDGRVAGFDIGTLDVAIHRVKGNVTDQFAFSEKEGVLRVVTVDEHLSVQIVKLPISNFANHTEQTNTLIPLTDGSSPQHQRWIGDWYLCALRNQNSIFAYNDATGKGWQIKTSGPAQKIEAMPGIGALLVVGTESEDSVVLSTIKLGTKVSFMPAFKAEGSTISEWRSDGFFFQSAANGALIGLPAQNEADREGYWGNAPSSVAFFGVDPSGLVSKGGQVVVRDPTAGKCEDFCLGLYGTTRTISVGDRIFVWMENELAEVSITARTSLPTPAKSKDELHLTEHGKRVVLTSKNKN